MLIGDDSATEEPRLSSAASLVRLRHLGHEFGPTYTHQCFDDERVRGFQPYDDALRETERRYAASSLAPRSGGGGGGSTTASASASASASTAGPAVSHQASRGLRESLVRSHDLPHKSFQQHGTATHRLAVEVVLAPSCRTCAVTIRTEPKKRARARDRSGSTASSGEASSAPSSRSVSPHPADPCPDGQLEAHTQPAADHAGTGSAGSTGSATSTRTGGGKRRRVGRNDSDCENSDRQSPPPPPALPPVGASAMSVLEQLDGLAAAGTNATAARTASSGGPKLVFSSKSTTGIPLAAGTMTVHPLSSYAAASNSSSGRTRRRRMEIDEVLARASRALPPVVRCDHIRTDEEVEGSGGGNGDDGAALQLTLVQHATLDEVREDYLTQPVGTVLREYQRPIRNANVNGDEGEMGDFVLCLADGREEGVAAYHNRVQGLALWYIENGSEVDLASIDSGGYWKVLYVFRRHEVVDGGSDGSKILPVAQESKAGDNDDDTKAAAGGCGDRSSSPSSPLVKRAVNSFYSTCDSLVTLFSGRGRQGNGDGRAFEETVNAEPLNLPPYPPSPPSQSSVQDAEEESSSPVQNEYSLVGFMTLFHYYSQYKKPSAGTICRMCQVVVLPSFQRAGHGKMMMRGAHDIAKGAYSGILPPAVEQRGDIVEVDVEDPAIEFTALRDRFDYEKVRDAIANDPRSALGVNVAGLSPSQEEYYLPIDGQALVEASSSVKITPHQIQIALELYKRHALDEEIARQMREKKKKPATKRQAVARLESMYEAMVKQRLYKVHREDIIGCGGGKAEKDAIVDYLYDETMTHYRSLLGKKKSVRSGGGGIRKKRKE